MKNNNNFIEKFLSKIGYTKSARIMEIISGQSTRNYNKPVEHKEYKDLEEKYGVSLWVYTCIYAIANAGAGLDLKVYDPSTDKVIDSHPFLDLIENPNDYMTKYDLHEWIYSSLELTGNSYQLLDRLSSKDSKGRPKEIYPLISSYVTIEAGNGVDAEGRPVLIDHYEYQPGNKKVKYYPWEILHWKYFNPRSLRYGLSAISCALQNIDIMHDMTTDAKKLFENSAQLDGVLESELKIPAAVKEQIIASWYKKYGGVEKRHQIGIADYGLKFKPTRATPREVEYIEGRKITREEICSAFGVPPAMVGLFEYSNYANAEAQQKIFWNDTMIPKIRKVTPIYQKLLNRFDDTKICYFDTSNVKALQADAKIQSETAKRYFDMGIPTNEIIDKLDLPFDEVEGGDVGYLPINLMAINVSRETSANAPGEQGTQTQRHSSGLTEKAKERKWNIKIRQTDRLENLMKPAVRGIYNEIKNQVYSRLGEYRSRDFSRGEEGQMVHKFTKQPLHTGVELFKYNEITGLYHDILKENYMRAIEQAGKREADFLGIDGFELDTSRPEVSIFIEERGLLKATAWVDGMRTELKTILQDGLNEGYGVPEIRKLMSEKVFAEDVANYRIDRITRTEISDASNFGSKETFKQSGVVKQAEWLTAMDERTCPFCNEMNGKVIDLSERFFNEGDSMRVETDDGTVRNLNFKFDIDNPPLHPNCRCDLIPII